MTEELRYGFGENWADYVEKNFDEERLRIAQSHLLGFLKRRDLSNSTFLDIGCGSGLHSFAAFRAGAKQIISFDYDPDSVGTTKQLRHYAGNPENWTVMQGSVLDRIFVESIDKADIVYSWGVLHHTDDMWNAIESAASCMKEDGVFYIALYTSDIYIDPPPEYWLRIKRRYNSAGPILKRLMEWRYALRVLPKPVLVKAPKFISEYQESRGMSFWTDVKDWLGGWPMEFAGIAETKAFCDHRLGLDLLNISAGEGNTEYLFRKKGAKNYWDDVRAGLRVEPLTGPFEHRGGYAWSIRLATDPRVADNKENRRRSRLMLYEDGVPVGFGHIPHAQIKAYGNGRYSHWEEELILSTTDNTDPNKNGRTYSICSDGV
jgi:SAM-dependent methyltransferase